MFMASMNVFVVAITSKFYLETRHRSSSILILWLLALKFFYIRFNYGGVSCYCSIRLGVWYATWHTLTWTEWGDDGIQCVTHEPNPETCHYDASIYICHEVTNSLNHDTLVHAPSPFLHTQTFIDWYILCPSASNSHIRVSILASFLLCHVNVWRHLFHAREIWGEKSWQLLTDTQQVTTLLLSDKVNSRGMWTGM